MKTNTLTAPLSARLKNNVLTVRHSAEHAETAHHVQAVIQSQPLLSFTTTTVSPPVLMASCPTRPETSARFVLPDVLSATETA